MSILATFALAAWTAFGPAAPAPYGDAATLAPDFAIIDANSDARLSSDEIGAWFASDDPAVDAFEVFDTNGDGAVTELEFEAMCFEPETGLDV